MTQYAHPRRWLTVRHAAAILLGFVLASEGHAAEHPTSSILDTRIQTVDYTDGDVITLDVGPALHVVFAEGEDIQDIASGFTQGWQIEHRGNQLYLKPKAICPAPLDKQGGCPVPLVDPTSAKWNTPLFVTTNRHVYTFQLNLRPGAQAVAWTVTLLYPGEAAAREKTAAKAQALATALERHAPVRDSDYVLSVSKGAGAAIAPSEVADDGRFTYLTFAPGQDMPSVYLVPEGTTRSRQESLVDTHIDPAHPDVLVVHCVAPVLRLRRDTAVVTISHRAPAAGVPDDSHTSVPGVMRTVRGTPTQEQP